MLSDAPNRLIHEKSPYLLQHAHNPVDWRPWGDESIGAARTAQLPIFLSIGYSTCYWCHVMEREVFENESIAHILNPRFICIKVDREERPDIDRIYMSAVQAMTGSGGWPMSLFLTPDLKPFFAGTYFPPTSRYGRPGFTEIITRISELWENDRASLLDSADKIIEHLTAPRPSASVSTPGRETIEKGFDRNLSEFDPSNGGFGRGMKFPRPATLDFLLRYHVRTGNADALTMVTQTLTAMSQGGIHDQIGGGFHRYAVDPQWRVPHFEKMLYDQAQLVGTYLDSYLITREQAFAGTARATLEFVKNSLTGPGGGFFSALDAESPPDPAQPQKKHEGAFYLWEYDEIFTLVGPDDAGVFCHAFGVKEIGNAASDPHQVFTGKNILYRADSTDGTAAHFGITPAEAKTIIDRAGATLLRVRALRPPPHLDDKIITAWNGLMISAFARGAAILEEPEYLRIAQQAARFLLNHCVDPGSGRLLRRYRDGEARFEAGLHDYACLIAGLLDLYEASFAVEWLEEAIRLNRLQAELFADETNGGFYETSGADATVIVRMKDDYDGAEPSGNSVAVRNLIRLSLMTADPRLKSQAGQTLGAFASRLENFPEAMPAMLTALDHLLGEPMEIIIAGLPGRQDTLEMLREIRTTYLPDSVTLFAGGADTQQRLDKILPVIHGMREIDGKTAVYICRNYSCNMPVTSVGELEVMLSKVR